MGAVAWPATTVSQFRAGTFLRRESSARSGWSAHHPSSPLRLTQLSDPVAGERRTLDQVEPMQAKAVRFLRDVAGDREKAEEFASVLTEEYAERKGAEVVDSGPVSTHRAMGQGLMTG